MVFIRLLLLSWFLCHSYWLHAENYIEIPKLSNRVTDVTGTLTSSQVQALESKLTAFETAKGSQIAVLMVGTTQPSDIAEFGIEVADLWKLGRAKQDDGLILIIAKDDRKVRLEVFDGLEGAIPDAVAKRIGSDTIAPYFKNNQYFEGINAGLDQVMTLIEKENLPAPMRLNGSEQKEGFSIFVLLGGLFAGSLFSSLFGRVVGGLLAGIGSGLVASFIMGFGIGAIMIGLIVFFLTSARFTGGGGGWSNGGGYYGGGGSWGGGGSGGSWSGGGGHASGGGATSSW